MDEIRPSVWMILFDGDRALLSYYVHQQGSRLALKVAVMDIDWFYRRP